MKSKGFIFKSMLLALVSLTVVSCSDDDDDYDYFGDVSNINGAYILNSGSQGSNNASLSFYDTDSTKLSTDVFGNQNGINLGDTGQDMLIYGGKIYIAMSDSRVIYVTDRNVKLQNSITSSREGELQKPRNFAKEGKYVYVTYYDGYVARIDTTDATKIDAMVQVGINPEKMAISNNKIYVANSGGMSYPNYDNTVSVIDINSFSVVKTVEDLVINPTEIVADNKGNVFVVSMGNYNDIPNTLQRINSDYTVDSVGTATKIALSKDLKKLYCIYAQWGVSEIEYKTYDIAAEVFESSPFVSSTVADKFTYSPFSLSINPKSGYAYIGTSDYKAEGKMYVVDPTIGELVKSFSTGGINPMGAYFIVK